MLSNKSRGQASVEYLVISVGLVMALLLPVPDSELTDSNWLEKYKGKNVMEILTDKFKKSYSDYSYAKSLPPLPNDFESLTNEEEQ
jgi:spore germination protein GerM